MPLSGHYLANYSIKTVFCSIVFFLFYIVVYFYWVIIVTHVMVEVADRHIAITATGGMVIIAGRG